MRLGALWIHTPDKILQLALGGIKAVSHCNHQILMRVIQLVSIADGNLTAGNPDVDAHLKNLAVVAVVMRRFDLHVTRNDAVMGSLQVLDPLADLGFSAYGRVHAVK